MNLNSHFKTRYLPLAILAVIGTPYAPLSHAAEPAQFRLEEVIVTAQRQAERLQDVPIAVVSLGAEALANRGVTSTMSLPEAVPGVQFQGSGGSNIFFVRGVGNTNAGIGEEGSNAFYVDGVYMPDLLQSAMRFNNIERVEVLKGPQGTLFGRNSSGGLVHVITKEPGDEFNVDVTVGYANYDKLSTQAYVAGPLSETVSADFALAAADQRDGWGKNQLTGADVAQEKYWGARSKVVWRPSNSLKITAAGEYFDLDETPYSNYFIAPGTRGMTLNPMDPNTPAPESPDNGFDTTATGRSSTAYKVYGGSLTAEIDLGWSSLTSITTYRKLKADDNAVDVDAGPYALLEIALNSETEAYQQEIRLASTGTDPLSWQVGLFYLHSTAEVLPQTITGQALLAQPPQGWIAGTRDVVKQTTESLAGFGEVGYALTPQTQITLGIRYTYDDRDLDGSQELIPGPAALVPLPGTSIRRSATDKKTTYRLAVRHDLSDNISMYASYNRGFKSGLFSMNAAPWLPVDPQTTDAYEIGLKSSLLDDRLRINLAAFHYKIDDYQVRASSDTNTQLLLNAAEVEVNGFELDFEAMLSERISLFGAVTVLDSEFSSFPNVPVFSPRPVLQIPGIGEVIIGGNVASTVDGTGNDTPMAPRYAGNIGAMYRMPVRNGTVLATAQYSYNDGYYFAPDNRQRQKSFGLLNMSLTYEMVNNWSLELWGRNLTDEKHYSTQLASEFSDWVVRAAPRTYGVNVRYQY